MSKKHLYILLALLVLGALIVSCGPAPVTPTAAAATAEVVATAEPGVTTIRWFVGPGAGGNPEEIKKEKAFVEKFNAENPQYQLVLDIVQNAVAYDVLKTQIASGNAPDIVGPVGIRGFYSFEGAWLDVGALAEKYNYDYSDYDPSLVKFLTWATWARWASLRDLSFRALVQQGPVRRSRPSLPAPQGTARSSQDKEWNFDTLRELAMQLTQDETGKTPTTPSSTPIRSSSSVTTRMWTDLRGELRSSERAASSARTADGRPSDVWKTAARWYFDGVWKDHFIPVRQLRQQRPAGPGQHLRLRQRGDDPHPHLVHVLLPESELGRRRHSVLQRQHHRQDARGHLRHPQDGARIRMPPSRFWR